MITSKQCMERYGNPSLASTQANHMEVWNVPSNIQEQFKHVIFSALGTKGFPKKIFINKEFKPYLEQALNNAIERNLQTEIKSWDGCFLIRKIRGGNSLSLHSWGIAIDINAKENGLGKVPKLSKELVKCFEDANMYWGGRFTRLDGMHFQLKQFNKT